jgi:molybdopterin-guanine dinucleotide biosynthesis protein
MSSGRAASTLEPKAPAAKIHVYTTGTIDHARSTHDVSFVRRDSTQHTALTTAATIRTSARESTRSG